MSNIRTNLPVPVEPWESAKHRFLEGLSAQEKQRFENATLENIFYDASVTKKIHQQKSKTWAAQERLSSLVDAIEDYGKALDIYSNAYGLILCPIWGSLRVIFHVSRSSLKHVYCSSTGNLEMIHNHSHAELSQLTILDRKRGRQISRRFDQHVSPNRRCSPTISHLPSFVQESPEIGFEVGGCLSKYLGVLRSHQRLLHST